MNKPNSILYYPHIEFKDEAWVKASLLLWDHVYRIVPENYTPNDSYEIQRLVDEDLVRNISLTEKDKQETLDEFLSLCDIIEENMPAGLVPSDDDDFRIHPGKIDKRLYPYLDIVAQYFVDEDRWLHMSKELARGYMFKLSQVVARIRNLNRGTDDTDAWSINPYFCEKANISDFLQDSSAEGFFCSVTLRDLIPQNIGSVSSQELISFLRNRNEERKLLRNSFHDMTDHLSQISDTQHAGLVNMDFIDEVLRTKEQYRNSMDSWKEIGTISLTTGIPASLSTLGTLAGLGADPFSLRVIGGSLAFGAICSYANFKKAKKKRDPSYASFLLDIDHLCERLPSYSYTTLEEFIND